MMPLFGRTKQTPPNSRPNSLSNTILSAPSQTFSVPEDRWPRGGLCKWLTFALGVDTLDTPVGIPRWTLALRSLFHVSRKVRHVYGALAEGRFISVLQYILEWVAKRGQKQLQEELQQEPLQKHDTLSSPLVLPFREFALTATSITVTVTSTLETRTEFDIDGTWKNLDQTIESLISLPLDFEFREALDQIQKSCSFATSMNLGNIKIGICDPFEPALVEQYLVNTVGGVQVIEESETCARTRERSLQCRTPTAIEGCALPQVALSTLDLSSHVDIDDQFSTLRFQDNNDSVDVCLKSVLGNQPWVFVEKEGEGELAEQTPWSNMFSKRQSLHQGTPDFESFPVLDVLPAFQSPALSVYPQANSEEERQVLQALLPQSYFGLPQTWVTTLQEQQQQQLQQQLQQYQLKQVQHQQCELSRLANRVWVCKICDMRFSRSDSLRRHAGKHQKELRFECPVCTKTFSRLDTLKGHTKRQSCHRKQQA